MEIPMKTIFFSPNEKYLKLKQYNDLYKVFFILRCNKEYIAAYYQTFTVLIVWFEL